MKKTVKFGVMAIGLSILGILLNFVETSLSLMWLAREPHPIQPILTILVSGLISLAILIASIVLFYIWLVKMYQQSNVFPKGYKKFLLLTIIFYGSLIIVQQIIWPSVLMGLYIGWMWGNIKYGFITGSNAFVTVIFVSIYAIAIIYSLFPLASEKEKKILTYVGVIYIAGLVPLHQLALYSIENIRTFYIGSLALYLPILLGVHLAFFCCYLSVYKALPDRDIPSKWGTEPKPSKGAAGKFKKRYLKFIGPNPYRSMFPVALIGILFGTFIGITSDDPLDDIGRLDPKEILDRFDETDNGPEADITAITDEVMEGEEMTYRIKADEGMEAISAYLTWTDEPDLIRRENQPDTFELGIHGERELVDTNSNDHGSEGEIFVQMDEVGGGTEFDIVVRLVEAGDQEMRNGIGFITWTDDSNEFELLIRVTYNSDGEEE